MLEECGMSYIWYNQFSIDAKTIKQVISNVKRVLHDQFVQRWRSIVNDTSKCILYRSYKENFVFEKYLVFLPTLYCKAVCKLRTSNHKLTIETGRYIGTPRNQRYCNMCDMNVVGDEYHFVFECTKLKKTLENNLYQCTI